MAIPSGRQEDIRISDYECAHRDMFPTIHQLSMFYEDPRQNSKRISKDPVFVKCPSLGHHDYALIFHLHHQNRHVSD